MLFYRCTNGVADPGQVIVFTDRPEKSGCQTVELINQAVASYLCRSGLTHAIDRRLAALLMANLGVRASAIGARDGLSGERVGLGEKGCEGANGTG